MKITSFTATDETGIMRETVLRDDTVVTHWVKSVVGVIVWGVIGSCKVDWHKG